MPILRYTLLRLVMIAGCLAVLWLLGLRGWLLAVVAIVVAALLSFLLLPRQAGEAAAVIAARRERRPDAGAVDRAIAQDDAEEDALLDGESVCRPPAESAGPGGKEAPHADSDPRPPRAGEQ